MDSLLFIIGIVVMIISTIMIVRTKKVGSESKESSKHTKESTYDKSYGDEMDFTDEEVEFISNFEPKNREIVGKAENFDLNLRESLYTSDLEKNDLDEEVASEEVTTTGEETDKKEAIAILYKEGLTSSEIAKKLELGKREVDIILKVKGLIK